LATAEAIALPRNALWRQIDEAAAKVARSRAHIYRQLAIIDTLDVRGLDTLSAQQLLEQYRLRLQAQEGERDRLIEELAALK
jgi:hypothetical protein